MVSTTHKNGKRVVIYYCFANISPVVKIYKVRPHDDSLTLVCDSYNDT